MASPASARRGGGGSVRLLGQEVMPAMREYGRQLGPTDPFEADAPVHLRYSADIKQMPQAAE
jgi:hypothetical protein